MLIAQLTDTHIKRPGELAYGRVDTAAHLRAAIAHLNALTPQPDLVLFTGDLTDHGTPDQMEHACSLLSALEIPLLAIPGNHDNRALFHQYFPGLTEPFSQSDLNYVPPFSYIADRGPLRFVMLDSTVPGEASGRLGFGELVSHAMQIETAKPTLIAIHHPPVTVGIGHMDRQNLLDWHRLFELVEAAPNILAIVCGHVHRTIHAGFAGTSVIVAPSPAHAVTLDLRPDPMPTFRMEPPAILLHRWQPDPKPYGRLVTHTSFIGDYGTDQPFFDANGRLLD